MASKILENCQEATTGTTLFLLKLSSLGFKKIQIKNGRKILENEEEKIYNGLTAQPLRKKISLVIQKVLNFIPQNKKNLIFSTYMSNFQEVLLNLLTNKSLCITKC